MKPTPKAMTPSAAYPYYDERPMQFRGVKVRASPKVSHPCIIPCALSLKSPGLALSQKCPEPSHFMAPPSQHSRLLQWRRHACMLEGS